LYTIGRMAIEQESELDKFFGPRESTQFTQGRWIEQPVFTSLALIEGTKSKFEEGLRIIHEIPETKGFQTNVSQIEVFYPWLLQKLELIKIPLPEMGIFDSADTATTIGDKLHRADILFNLICDRVDPMQVPDFLPSHKTQAVAIYQAAMEGRVLSNNAGRDEIEEALTSAWITFHTERGHLGVSNTPLFERGFVNPQAKEDIFYGDEVFEKGKTLAKAWAREVTSYEPITWEFDKDAFTQREVLTSMNYQGPKLQFIARIDSISRFGKIKKKVESQVIDLKTGKKPQNRGLRQDIEIRQAQVTRVSAERFVSKYSVGGGGYLKARQEAFYWAGDHTNRAHLERTGLVGYRRFRPDGSFEIEPIEMNEADRREFEDWFTWYGAMIHRFRPELEVLRVRAKKAGFHYDLRNISISELGT